jgi:hypothetical protein
MPGDSVSLSEHADKNIYGIDQVVPALRGLCGRKFDDLSSAVCKSLKHD